MPTETMRSNRSGTSRKSCSRNSTGSPFSAARHRALLLRERDAGHRACASLREIKRQAAPAAADVEHALALPQHQLGGEVPALGELRVVERLIGRLEIGAAVLPIAVEEERVEPAVEI